MTVARINLMRFPGGTSKALTLSYDDGVLQDRRLVQMMNQYGVRGTFNLNSRILGRVDEMTLDGKKVDISTVTAEEAAGLYENHEIATHGAEHSALSGYGSAGLLGVLDDRRTFEPMVSYMVRGHAYPFGLYDENVVSMLQAAGTRWGEMVGKELVEFTRRMFPLSYKREDTFIGGLSMGGFGAARLGSYYPGTFGKIFSLSGAFIVDDIAGKKEGYTDGVGDYYYYCHTFGDLKQVKDSAKDPFWCMKQAVNSDHHINMYMACGEDDFLVEKNAILQTSLGHWIWSWSIWKHRESMTGNFGMSSWNRRSGGC